MESEKKDNRGSIFKNSFKYNPKQPDMTGKALINGVEYRISAWENMTITGNVYLSMSFQTEEEFQSHIDKNKQENEIDYNSEHLPF